MTSQPKKATLSEWAKRLDDLLIEIGEDGYDFEATACCCGEGLRLKDPTTGEDVWVL